MSRSEVNEFTTSTYGFGIDEVDCDTEAVMWQLATAGQVAELSFYRNSLNGRIGIVR